MLRCSVGDCSARRSLERASPFRPSSRRRRRPRSTAWTPHDRSRQRPFRPTVKPVHGGAARLGLVEGVNLVTDHRSARGNRALLDALAADLVAAQPDVLFASSGFVAAWALKKATTTIPIVFLAVGEPVAAGLVASLARPGGNLTGGSIPVELDLKRVQILFDVLGRSASVALLTTPVSEARMAFFLRDLAASRLRLQFQEVRKPEDLAPAFEQIARQRVSGVAVAGSLLTSSHQPEIAALALKHRIPPRSATGRSSPTSD